MGAVLDPALFILHSASWALSWELGALPQDLRACAFLCGPLLAVIDNLKTYWGRSSEEYTDRQTWGVASLRLHEQIARVVQPLFLLSSWKPSHPVNILAKWSNQRSSSVKITHEFIDTELLRIVTSRLSWWLSPNLFLTSQDSCKWGRWSVWFLSCKDSKATGNPFSVNTTKGH